ncbi:SRPBCC domain-containing protein [Priestia filamentosa]|uniref:SRPBCC family protein n=1 Tax=Priestia filamentosa TaxID=1402861 RepID=UPI003D2BED11
MEYTLQDIKQTVVIEAPIQKVWEQVSTADGIAAWFMPNDFLAEVGHEFHLQSPFGPSPCKVTELDPPNRLSFTWDTEGWFVSFILKELEEKTEFTLIHGGWKQRDELMNKANEKASVIHGRMSGGWVGILGNIRRTVES